ELSIIQSVINDEDQTSGRHQCSEGTLGSLLQQLSILTIEDLTELAVAREKNKRPNARATRQQLAKEQAGQLDLSLEERNGLSAIRFQGDFLLSLIAGRSAGNPRSIGGYQKAGRTTTNRLLFLADEATQTAATEQANNG